MKSYKDLMVWNKSMDLVSAIYLLTKSLSEDEKFGLISQMKRSSISIPSNIAEGWGRGSSKSYTLFLKNSRGSLLELETQIELCKRLSLVSEVDLELINSLMIEVSKMLNSMIKKMNDRIKKGESQKSLN